MNFAGRDDARNDCVTGLPKWVQWILDIDMVIELTILAGCLLMVIFFALRAALT